MVPSESLTPITPSNERYTSASVPWRAGFNTAARLVLPSALFCLGARKLLTQSFIPGWQPVAAGSPHVLLAIVDAALLMALAGLAVAARRRDLAFWGLACLLAAWILILQSPGLMAMPSVTVLWLGVAEVGALIAASILLATEPVAGPKRRLALRRIGFTLFGLCCLVFGASHFVYVDFTSKMIPSWMPARIPLAYLTGIAHGAAGLAIASSVLRRPAAILLACMMGVFVIVIHIPAVVSSHASMQEITFLLNACALCGSAMAVARVAAVHR